jgi:hypothetical protein
LLCGQRVRLSLQGAVGDAAIFALNKCRPFATKKPPRFRSQSFNKPKSVSVATQDNKKTFFKQLLLLRFF